MMSSKHLSIMTFNHDIRSLSEVSGYAIVQGVLVMPQSNRNSNHLAITRDYFSCHIALTEKSYLWFLSIRCLPRALSLLTCCTRSPCWCYNPRFSSETACVQHKPVALNWQESPTFLSQQSSAGPEPWACSHAVAGCPS